MPIDIEKELGDVLLQVRNPARYIGGEYHYGTKDMAPVDTYAAICFPDLYEIGMSNNAVRILYDAINRMEHVSCDRVFAVDLDFEQLLRERDIPLFTLDSRTPINELDMLGISLGYELAATNILQILSLGKIPLHCDERGDDMPIVIMGGPAATNPLPFSRFIDFTYIGEGEQGLPQVMEIIRNCKLQGIGRRGQIEVLKELDFLWYPGKKLALRDIDEEFTTDDEDHRIYKHYVVPNFKVAQDNGVVEIMRGCPNGCRFCHAGQFYKPYRQKTFSRIAAQVEQNVHGFGYREVTLSSLSSGDHPYIKEMIQALNTSYSGEHVSFSLPSLKVSSFSLGILEQLSEVRKSGLTFAIETPLQEWQRSVNKEVPLQSVIDIIREAKARGWKLAKFYFMVGLPFVDREKEEAAIVEFLGKVYDATRIGMNINIGTFIPKAHTPFQWAVQMRPEVSYEHLRSIKRAIQDRVRGCKVSYHEPDISYIEGLISRGDERTSQLIERAYDKGCRLDAWDEHLQKELWHEAIAEMPFNADDMIFAGYDIEQPLPWDSVSMRVGKKYLKDEYLRAKDQILTSRCTSDCQHPCGACTKEHAIEDVTGADSILQALREAPPAIAKPMVPPQAIEGKQILFTYRKEGRALYVSHISAMRIFEMAFQRSGLEILFTQGFNPKPKLEFVNPLSVGMRGEQELLLAELNLKDGYDPDQVVQALQNSLSEGFVINDMLELNIGRKTTLAKYLSSSRFEISAIKDTKITERLEALLVENPTHEKFKVRSLEEGTYEVTVFGEKNLVKLLFGDDVDKFKLCSDCSIVRKALSAGPKGIPYREFFQEMLIVK